MSDIKNTSSLSITAPSRMNNNNLKPLVTPTFTPHTSSTSNRPYTPPSASDTPITANLEIRIAGKRKEKAYAMQAQTKANEPLPSHLFKTFQRKIFVKQDSRFNFHIDSGSRTGDNSKSTTVITISPPPNSNKQNQYKANTKNIDKKDFAQLTPTQDLNDASITYDTDNQNESDFPVTPTHLNNYHRKSGHDHPMISTPSQSSDEDETSPIPNDHGDRIHKYNHGYPANNIRSINVQSPDRQDKRGSFSSLNHWLSAKRSTCTMFSGDYPSTYLQPFDEQNDDDMINNRFTSNLHPMDATREVSPSVSEGIRIIIDNVVCLNNLPSPNVLRRISKSKENKMDGFKLNSCGVDDDNQNVDTTMNIARISTRKLFAPPLTQQMLNKRIARPSLFNMGNRKRSIIKDVNLIIDIGENFCALCQNMYDEDEILIILSCTDHHQFHESCIKEWFQYKSVCPICKKKMWVL